MKKISTTALLAVFFINTNAQQIKTSHNYQWETPSIMAPEVKEEFKHDNAVILLEETSISFVSFATPLVTKRQTIKFLNSKGIKEQNTFILPESFDQSGSKHLTSTNVGHNIYGPKLYVGAVKYFAARILKANGQMTEAVIKDSVEYERVNDKDFYAYFYIIKNLEAGDILEICYEHLIPAKYYLEKFHLNFSIYSSMFYTNTNHAINTMSRVFLNGSISKQQYKLTFKHNKNQFFEVKAYNGAQFTDSTEEGLITTYVWKRENLHKGIDEYASRPYETLPYITLHFNANNFKKETSNEFVYSKYTWQSEFFPLMGYKWSRTDVARILKTEDRNTLTTFINENIPDTTMPLPIRIQRLHEAINEEYKYACDQAYYSKIDTYTENLSDYIRGKKTLRDISRYRFYNLVMNDQTSTYYLAAISDKRIERLNEVDFKPYLTVNWYYAVPLNVGVLTLSPKRHRFGLHVNEFPFYLENTRCIYVPQSTTLDVRNDAYRHVPINAGRTPVNTFEDNFRKTNVMVNISTETMNTTFEAKIELQGQYSTMCRGFYKYGYKDSTANPKYATSLASLKASTSITSQTIIAEDINFPFKTEVKIKYESKNVLRTSGDGAFTLNIGNWFNHITKDDFNAERRSLPFYNDFLGSDTYRYNIVFDKNIELLNGDSLNKTIETPAGSYIFNVRQLQPNIIMCESRFVLKKERVPVDEVLDIQKIYYTIQKINNSQLELKLTSK